jgi:hypothetical protein
LSNGIEPEILRLHRNQFLSLLPPQETFMMRSVPTIISRILRLITMLFATLSIFLSFTRVQASSSTQSTATKFPLPGLLPDPFVAVAPLILGVVCKDAVLLLALHTAFANNTNDESFLLLPLSSDAANGGDDNDVHENNTEELFNNTRIDGINVTTPIAAKFDLPRGYRGPFRIYSLDAGGTAAMVCAGWRTDGQRLVEYIQSIVRTEVEIFGEDDPRGSGSMSASLEYGSYLACQASQRMADLCLRSGYRPMSAVGLLASCGDDGDDSDTQEHSTSCGGLWLVDATGAYRVRAHAVGGGASLSGQVNEFLRHRDWTQVDCNTVAKELICLLLNKDGADNNGNIKRADHDGSKEYYTNIEVPEGTLVEMVAVGMKERNGKNRRLTRLFSSTLFGLVAAKR